jgi:hypothetical protein
MALKPCEISKFKGVNRIIDASKLEPGEMTTLQGAIINTGSLCNMPMPSYELADQTLPIPYFIENKTVYGLGGFDPTLATNHSTIPGILGAGGKIALFSLSSIPTGVPVTIFFLVQKTFVAGAGSQWLYVDVYDAVGPNPSTNRTLKRLSACSVSSSDPKRVWMGYTLVVDPAAVNPRWVVLTHALLYGSTMEIWGHPSASHNQDCQVYNGSSWSSWATSFPGKAKPQFAVVSTDTQVSTATNSARLITQMGKVDLPFEPFWGAITAGSYSFTGLTNWGNGSLCVLDVPRATSTYKRAFIMDNGINDTFTGTGLIANVVPRINLVRVGSIVAATSPGCRSCVPITLMDVPYQSSTSDFSAAVFDKYLLLTGGGTDGGTYGDAYESVRNRKPCYLDLASNGSPVNSGGSGFQVKSFSSTPPDEPQIVVSFGGYPIYAKNRLYPYRMWYGQTAGTVDTFLYSSATCWENLSMSEAILNLISDGSEMLVVFASSIFKYSGVPRYANYRCIHEAGARNGSSIIKAHGGVFLLLSDGLWFYTGAFSQIIDKPKIFNFLGGRRMGLSSNFMVHQSRMGHLENQHALVFLLEQSYYDTPSHSNSTLWLYDYWTGDFFQYWLNDSLGNCGIFQVECLPYDTVWLLDYPYVPNYSGLMCESSTHWSPMNVETGWIDPLPVMDKKHFLHFTMEATNTVASLLISLTVTYDNGVSYTWSDIDLHTAADSDGHTPIYTKIEKQVSTHAGRFKVAITCNVANPSTPTTEQIKIHKFTLWWDDGKPK